MLLAVTLVWPILILAWMACLPVGILVAIFGRRKRRHLILGTLLILVSIPIYVSMHVFFLWGFDALRGWEMSVPVSVPGYEVRLVQKPGGDFYDSYFEVVRSDGRTAVVWIDSDDRKWRDPETVERDGRIYFTRDLGRVTVRTSYVDPANDVIYSGYYRQTHTLSELDFE